ncbi:hypothetical protein QUB47_01730 [Microcoleus sp. AT9_B5]
MVTAHRNAVAVSSYEFSHQDDTTYAMETIPATKLMLLHNELLESVGAIRR